MRYDDRFEKERDSYYDESELELNHDWALWNDEDNSAALLSLWHILNAPNKDFDNDTDRIAEAKDIIRELMWDAAKGHVSQVMLNYELD